jgi:hypothetical protein
MKIKLIEKEIIDLQELKEEYDLDTDKEYEVIKQYDDNSVDIQINDKGKVLNFYHCEYEEVK